MKFLALSVILALAVSLSGALSVDQGLHQEWELFKNTHSKVYSESEDAFRMKVFLDNREKVLHQPALTGGLRELLHPSRIRNSADPAGLSLLLVHWKDNISVKPAHWCL